MSLAALVDRHVQTGGRGVPGMQTLACCCHSGRTSVCHTALLSVCSAEGAALVPPYTLLHCTVYHCDVTEWYGVISPLSN